MLTPAAATEELRVLTQALRSTPLSAEDLDTATETAIQAMRTLRDLLHSLSAVHTPAVSTVMDESGQVLDLLAGRLDAAWTAAAAASQEGQR